MVNIQRDLSGHPLSEKDLHGHHELTVEVTSLQRHHRKTANDLFQSSNNNEDSVPAMGV